MVDAIFPIVEGHGEVRAIPILLRRFAVLHEKYGLHVITPFRLPKGQMIETEGLERVVEFGARKLAQHEGRGAILIILDADDDCPATRAPELLSRAQGQRPDIPVRLVIAKSEFEAWFLAAARSLRRQHGVRENAVPPEDPESIRDAKGYFQRTLLVEGRRYSPTVDQPALTALFDISEARVAPSFDKLYRDLDGLLSGGRDRQ